MGRIYQTSKGYAVRLHRGGYGARDQYRPSSNDFSTEPLIDAAMKEVCAWGWADKAIAQQVLDKLAIEQGWSEISESEYRQT